MSLPLNSALEALPLSGIRRFTALAKQTPGCILLTLGEPEFDTPQTIRQAAIQSLQQGDTHYPPNNGKPQLLNALSQFAKTEGLCYDPEEIVVTVGATGALFSTLAAILEPGDEVLVPTPAFGLYESIIGLCRGVYRPVDTSGNGFQLTSQQLEQAVSPRTKAIILTSPGNPTGCVYNGQSLEAVAQLARRTGLYVICDDVYTQLVYTSQMQRFAVAYPDLRSQVVVVNSFSKPYAMTGWRAGWLMAHRPLKEQIQKVHQYSAVSVNSFIQDACVQALATDVSQMVQIYKARRDYVCTRLEEMNLPAFRPEGAFYAFPSVAHLGLDAETFCTRLIQEGGVALVPGTCFGTPGHVRLSYCCGQEQLEEGLNRLQAFVSKLNQG